MDLASTLINNGFGVDGIGDTSTLTWFAQLLIIGVEFIGPLLYAWNIMEAGRDQRSGRSRPLDQHFDFIVVGGGSAGAVVANRLSASHKVLLIEAGGTPSPLLRVPILTYVVHGKDTVDWKYKTVPQKSSSFGLINNSTLWTAGKGLGGSSNINGMIFLRGNVQGFDIVANFTGNPKWRMSNVLKFYKSLEDYHGYFDDGINHGKGGHLSIEKSHLHRVTKQLLRAGTEFGYKVRDANAYGPVTEGFAPMDFYLKNGRRWSSYNGYLQDIIGQRQSLSVLKYATVEKVLIKNGKAYGVQYWQYGRMRKVYAQKEVILSAGSIQSAKILMLSGIGPKGHLNDLGIKVVVDSPVGSILQDKYGAALGPFVTSEGTSFVTERDLNLRSIREWAMSGTGPVQCSRTEATFTISSSLAYKEGLQGHPDIHTYFLAMSMGERYGQELQNAFGIKSNILENYFGKVKGQDSFLQMVTINRVKGTGTLKLRSKDPFDQPLLDPKYLQNPHDMAVLLEGLKFSLKLVEESKAYKRINASLISVPLPGCEGFKWKSDEYLECYARHLTLTAYKYAATAPMGKDRSDPEAVVDPELRVFGVKGLRVIDGSVLQIRHVNVNHVTIQAVAELASQMILDHWKTPGTLQSPHFSDSQDDDTIVNNFIRSL